jgi:hypothetical protein
VNHKVNLAEKLRLVDQAYRLGIVCHLNAYKLMVVKVRSEFVSHGDGDTDDFVLVL